MEYMIYPTQATLDSPFKCDYITKRCERLNADARQAGIHTDKQRMLDLVLFYRLHNDVLLYQRDIPQ